MSEKAKQNKEIKNKIQQYLKQPSDEGASARTRNTPSSSGSGPVAQVTTKAGGLSSVQGGTARNVPAPSADSPSMWVPVCRFDELPTDGGGLSLAVGPRQVAVFRDGDGVVALDDSCPHEGASLGLGVLKDGDVTCPWHGFHFCARTGESTDGLDERVRVRPARVGGSGEVEVELPSS